MNKIVSSESVKRAGSPLDSGSGTGAEKRSRKKVEIPNDTWLVALKFLTAWENWTSMRFVSFQVNGVIESNTLRLPLLVIENANGDKVSDDLELRLTGRFWNRLPHSLQVLYHPAVFSRNVYLNVRQRDLSSIFPPMSHVIFAVESSCLKITKFQALTVIDSRIPTIMISPYYRSERYREHLGPNLIERENDNSPDTEAVYIISNGDNRMRVSFCKCTNIQYSHDEWNVCVKFYTV